MRNKARNRKLVMLTAAAFWTWQGCNLSNLIPPVDIPLQSGLAEFSVNAGEPASKVGQFSFDSPVTIGSGTLALTPEAVAVAPADESGNKSVATAFQQAVDECLNACAAAGLDSARCDRVCNDRVLEVTIWIGSPDEEETVCETGDSYGPFRVELDADFNPSSIEPSSVTLTQRTRDLLNDGAFSVCIEVVSPVDGAVIIQSLRFRVGL